MISRRSLLQTLGTAVAAQSQTPKKRPNLLFLFSDQHAYDTMGCSGNKFVRTPVMDKLSSEGIHFTHCFSTAPVCSPYRSMLLSGMHPLQTGVFMNDNMMIPGKGKYFGEALRDAGYRTAYYGKWHVLGGNRVRPIPPGELRYGFDGPFLSNNCTTIFDAARAYYWNQSGEQALYGEWEPYGQSRQACAFLDQQDDGHPFAMFVSWHPPHDHGKKDQYYIYDTLPELEALYEKTNPALRPAAAQLDPSERRKQQCRAYMAQTTGIDRALGMVLDKLKEKGLDRDTIVVYTSDHGDCLGAYGWHLSAKDIPQDCSSHVPFLLRYPGVLGTRKSSLMLGPLDLMPTLLGLMGVDVPGSCQGRDLSKAILAADDSASDAVPMAMFHSGPEEYRGVITRDWTFSTQRTDREFHPLMNCLYDRHADPAQMHNLFMDNKPVRKRMMELTRSWMERFEDTFVSAAELNSSGIEWRYPEHGEPINRTSPLEWAKKAKPKAMKFHEE